MRTLLVIGLWSSVIVAWFVSQRASGSSTTEFAQRFVDGASGTWWAIVAYAALSALRPVVLFPASVLTVVAGLLFGAVLGVVVAALAANGSALIAYHLGRQLRRPPGGAGGVGDDEMSRIEAWTQRLRTHGFEAVLLMRLLFLPYDAVSYVCGLVRVPAQQFLAANAIGTLPGTVAFVLVGASIERLDEGFGGIDGTTLTVSVVLVVASIAASRVVRRRQSAVPG